MRPGWDTRPVWAASDWTAMVAQSPASGARRQWTVTARPLLSTSTPGGAEERSRSTAPRTTGRQRSSPGSHRDRTVRAGPLETVEPDQADGREAIGWRGRAGRASDPVEEERRRPARDHRHHVEPPAQPGEDVDGAVDRSGLGRIDHDRGQGAVEVGDDGRRRRMLEQRCEQPHHVRLEFGVHPVLPIAGPLSPAATGQ